MKRNIDTSGPGLAWVYHVLVLLILSGAMQPSFAQANDTLFFPRSQIGRQVCSTYYFVNPAKTCIASRITRNSSTVFTVDSVFPSFPAVLKTGDTLKINVCFTPSDTLDYEDSLQLTSDCFIAELPVSGKGGTALIEATDIDFGDVVVGTTARKPLTIRNKGSLPLLITKDWILHNSTLFGVDIASQMLLPAMLAPGGKGITLFCTYNPQAIGMRDSTTIDWKTDISEPYTHLIKSFSILNGNPVKPAVVWDRSVQYFIADSSVAADSVIQRVRLINKSGVTTLINNVIFTGPTTNEFSILDDQLGKKPPLIFDMNAGDTIWIDVLFKPDLTKTYPLRYADRKDSIAVLFFNPAIDGNDTSFLPLIGTFVKSGVKASQQLPLFTIRPNPSNGGSIVLSFAVQGSEKAVLQIFDVLGHQVYNSPSLVGKIFGEGTHEEVVTLPNLEEGMYYARLTVGNQMTTQKLEIVR